MKPTASRRPKLLSKSFPCSVFLSLFAAMPAAQAAQITWAGGTAIWQTGASWTGGNAPANSTTTDTALFSGSATATAQLNAARSIAGITISNTGATNIQSDGITSRALTIGASGIDVQAGAGAVTFGVAANNPLTVTASGSQNWTNNSSNAISFAGAVTSGAGVTLTLGGSGNFSFNANNSVNATSVWDHTGSGQLTFGGNANAGFSGTLNIGSGGGTLVLSNATVLASAAGVNIKGGTIAANNNRTLSANTVVSSDFTLGQASGNTGNVTLSGNMNLSGAVRSITGVSGHTDVISGVISNGGITKTGAGQLNLTGASANTYSGTTTVNEGTLFLQKTGVNAIVGGLTIGDGTSSDIVNLGASEQIADNVVVNMIGTASGQRGNFQLLGFNETIGGLSGDGQVQNASSTGNSVLTLDLANTTTQTSSAVLRNTGGSTTGNLSILKKGGGTQVLSGNMSYTGTTTVDAGTLKIASNSTSTGAVVINGGTLQIGDGGTTGSIASTSGVTNNAALVYNRSNDLTATYAIGGSGTLEKQGAGMLTLTNTSSYTGATTVSAGTLVVNGNISTSSLTTVQSGATLGGSGTVGDLTIDAGGFFSPGNSPGIMTVGDYIQNGQLNIEVDGLAAGNGAGYHDQVVVNGAVSLTGSLNLVSFANFTPVNGDLLFVLLNDGSDAISGTFSGLAQGAVVGNYLGFDWQISYTGDSTGNTFTGGNDVVLMAVPEPNVAALLGGVGAILLLRRRRA